MILKVFLLIYFLCGCATCMYAKHIIDEFGGFDAIYDAAKVLDPKVAKQMEKYDFNSFKIQLSFIIIITLIWPYFVPTLFNKY